MIFKGTATAIITPFTKDGVDFDAFDKLLDFQIANGVNAVVVLGTTGEASTLTYAERDTIITFAVKKLKGIVPVIVGTGANATAIAIENSKMAERLGADAILVVTPYYNKATQNGLVAHYSAIAESVSLPIIAYNVPSRTGCNMLPATFKEITDKNKNVVAMKEASGNMEQFEEYLRLASDDIAIYSGEDGLIVPTMAMGGMGVISVISNVIPSFCSQMTDACLGGDFATASKMQLKALPFVRAIFSEVNPIPVKMASKHMGLSSGIVRLPLTEMTEPNAKVLIELLGQF